MTAAQWILEGWSVVDSHTMSTERELLERLEYKVHRYFVLSVRAGEAETTRDKKNPHFHTQILAKALSSKLIRKKTKNLALQYQ